MRKHYLKQKYPMAWVLFGNYYYNKLRYFMLSQKKYYADKPRNTSICGILQQDIIYESLDSLKLIENEIRKSALEMNDAIFC